MAEAKEMTLSFVSPARSWYEGPIQSLSLPGHNDGLFGILPGHAPLLSILGTGKLTLKSAELTEEYFIDGGFLEIQGNRATVLADSVELLSELDEAVVRREFDELMQTRATGADLEDHQRKVETARMRMRLKKKKSPLD